MLDMTDGPAALGNASAPRQGRTIFASRSPIAAPPNTN